MKPRSMLADPQTISCRFPVALSVVVPGPLHGMAALSSSRQKCPVSAHQKATQNMSYQHTGGYVYLSSNRSGGWQRCFLLHVLSVWPQATGWEPVQSCTGQSLGFPSAGKHSPGTLSDTYPFDVTIFECGLAHN